MLILIKKNLILFCIYALQNTLIKEGILEIANYIEPVSTDVFG